MTRLARMKIVGTLCRKQEKQRAILEERWREGEDAVAGFGQTSSVIFKAPFRRLFFYIEKCYTSVTNKLFSREDAMKRVSAGRLSNGVRYYTQFDPRSHVSGVGVRVGSLYDPPQFRGMCHLVEHILGDYGCDNELKLEEYGCGPDENINIRVDPYSTLYGHGLLLRREYARELFNIFADGLKNPSSRVSEEGLKRERAAVLNEYYLRGKDALETELDDLVHKYLYQTNSARNRIDCEPDDLAKIRVSDVRRFIWRNYHAGNIFVILLGVPFRTARRIAERHFGEFPARSSEYPVINEARPTLPNIKFVEVERRGIHQYHVAVAFPTWPMGHKDDEAIEVFSEILRLRIRRIRDENYELGKGAYRTPTRVCRSFAHGLLFASFATPSKEYAEQSIGIIFEECERLKRERISDAEIATMIGKFANKYRSAFTDDPALLSEMIVDATCNGDEEMTRLNSYLGRLSRVGPRTLRRAANEYLTTKNCLVVMMKPDGNGESNERIWVHLK